MLNTESLCPRAPEEADPGVAALVAAVSAGDDPHIRDLLRCLSLYADTRLLRQLGRALRDVPDH
ncbi:hypothetical protein [Streptacidiphilus sp. ASG 303]|uniref:hypothetical protein n=1 Tax=Streptomycetaceae TaxID=2062 RepID=UPI001E63EC0D|nr:hypothetical protein [Streptacidiphilus sp. ASG 303]MCD0481094.1 hypothetical protein [Streptacidiphilus sp. ASG 303]